MVFNISTYVTTLQIQCIRTCTGIVGGSGEGVFPEQELLRLEII